MRVVFLGNHTVGVRALEVLLETVEVVGVVAHPPDPEDGVRYLSVHDYAKKRGLPTVRLKGRDPRLEEFLTKQRPDLLWITDYRYLIPYGFIGRLPLGAVNLHPSLLPEYRGRAPINWAILNGEKEIGLTAHFVDEGMDSGDIIVQERIALREDQDVGDALAALYPLYTEVTRKVLAHLQSGTTPRRPQDHRLATEFPRRKPEDGLIDWGQPARRVRDLVRAVARPYPGAFTFLKGRKVVVWSAALTESVHTGAWGEIVAVNEEGAVVRAGEGHLLLRAVEDAESGEPVELAVGDTLHCKPPC